VTGNKCLVLRLRGKLLATTCAITRLNRGNTFYQQGCFVRKVALILMAFTFALLLGGASAPAQDITSGLNIDPEIITQRGNDNGGLTTYGLGVDLFSPESQKDAAAVAAAKQAAQNKTVGGLFLGQEASSTAAAEQAQRIVFSKTKSYQGENRGSATSSWQFIVLTTLLMITVGVISYVATKAFRKRKRG